MQIAVVLPDEMVDDLDRLVPIQFRSRAEAVRHAVQRLLAAEHEAAVDRRYVEAYKISICAGTGPIWRPALNTQVLPMRSAQAPSGLNGGSCTWPVSTMSG